jgi:cellulose biosynthesis protein BcsQ
LHGAPKPLDESIKASDYDRLDLLPADFSHRNLDISFERRKRSRQRLDIALRHLRNEYDVIILDCPPTINIVAENTFNAADRLLVPLIPTTLSVHSHEQLLSFLADEGRSAKRVHAFFSMVDARRSLHQQVMTSLEARFDGILQNTIPFLAQIEQMGIHREPVPAFAPKSRAARSYEALWDEIRLKMLKERRAG